MLPALDTTRLAELGDDLGDAEFLVETVGIFLSELPGRRAAMHTAFHADDRVGMRESAHSLGSASAMLGVLELESTCRAVELRAGDVDAAGLAVLLAQWTSSCDGAQSAVQEWLGAQGSNR